MTNPSIPPPPDTQTIANDYGFAKADILAQQDIFDRIKKLNDKAGEMQKEGVSPFEIMTFLILSLEPEMLGSKESQLKILSDQMNVTSDYRNLITYVQNGINAFKGLSKGADADTLRTQIQSALDAIHSWAKVDSAHTPYPDSKDHYVLDDQTISQINQAYDALNGPDGIPAASGDLIDLWDNASKTGGEGSPAAQHLKDITDSLNTVTQGVSVFGQGAQTNVQYTSEAYKQLFGQMNTGVKTLGKENEVMVQNQNKN